MPPKRIIGNTVSVLVLIVVVWIVAIASTMATEASKTDSMLKSAVNSHEKMASVLVKANDLGFDMEPVKSGSGRTSLAGKGSVHPVLVVYRTWLTLTVDSDRDGATTGYHLDRASAFF